MTLSYTMLDKPQSESHRVLVHSFSGFMDAGSASQLAVDHLLERCDTRLIASFDPDDIIDFRARRPRMTFEADHFTGIDVDTVRLHEATDLRGTRFLVLSGPEPDYRWGDFSQAIVHLIEEFEVELTVGLIGIPWPAPHTRPIGVSFHATNPELIAGHTSNLGKLEIPGHMGALLELVLGQSDNDAMGLAVQVPHYLVQFDYPRAAIALLRGLAGATGLALPTDELDEEASAVDEDIGRQTQDSDEFAPLLTALESQYDLSLQDDGQDGETSMTSGMPDADQIGVQVERFLSEMDSHRPDGS